MVATISSDRVACWNLESSRQSPLGERLEPSDKSNAFLLSDFTLVVFLLTMLVIALGMILWLCLQVRRLKSSLSMDAMLLEVMKVLHDNLKLKDIGGGESEESDGDEVVESPIARHQRYENAEDMSQVAYPDEWRELHYGQRFGAEGVERQLDEMHAILRTRLERLECEWDEAEVLNDLDTMRQIEFQIMETNALLPRT